MTLDFSSSSVHQTFILYVCISNYLNQLVVENLNFLQNNWSHPVSTNSHGSLWKYDTLDLRKVVRHIIIHHQYFGGMKYFLRVMLNIFWGDFPSFS